MSATENQAHDVTDSRGTRCKYYGKEFLKLLFSHIGLCGLVVAYSILGGFMFEHLEKPNEEEECLEAQRGYKPIEDAIALNISTIFSTGENFTMVEIKKVLKIFRHEVIELGYDGMDCDNMGADGGPGYRWSFSGSLLFSVTIITTIGYGNIAPRSFRGRIGCVLYATLGIPLMFLWLAKLGDAMADIFRFFYVKICCCCCCLCRRKNKKVKDADEERNKSQEMEMLPESQEDATVVVDDDDKKKMTVPLWMTVIIICGYIFLGSVLFGIVEGWGALDAAYFCFITISTIGFGDLVPGTSADLNKTEDQGKMIGAAVYILFGMAILSMCFSLIQEDFVSKVRWVGEKMGIVEKDSDEEQTQQP